MTTNVIFDFDGVLVDSFDFHLRKVNELYGVELTAAEYRDIHEGNFYANGLDKLEGIDFHEYAKQVSQEEGGLPFCSDANELLRELHTITSLHLVTSGWEVQVMPFLKNKHIDQLFTSFWFADQGASKSEKLGKLLRAHQAKPVECVFVTDTLGDIRAAKKVNMPSVGVTFGYHDRVRLEVGEPDMVVDTWDELQTSLILMVEG
jgi:HAD superfamily hydrolase (TIGR01509 family)